MDQSPEDSKPEPEFDDEDIALLPEEFQVLAPHIQTWCIGDDVARSDAVENATTKELEAVVVAVEPLMDRINEYLDAFGDAVPWHACALVNLSEATAEISMEIERRSGKDA